MAPKNQTQALKPQSTEGEGSQTDDTRDALLAEVVTLTQKVDTFTAEIRREFAAAKSLVGRLEDRCNALHDRHNQTHQEWATMKAQMQKHHLEQSTGADTVGAAVRKATARLDLLEKNLQHQTDPHKITNPLKVEVAKVSDGMTALRQTVERRLTEFREELESKLPELKRAGKPRVS